MATSVFKEALLKLEKCLPVMPQGEPFDCVGYKDKLIDLCQEIIKEATNER